MTECDIQTGKWIWYPGDFEIFLGLKVHSSRYERTTQITPIWRLDTVYPNVKFRKSFKIEEEETVFIFADGTIAVELDGFGLYYHNFKDGIHLTTGSHSIIITVFNKETLPSILIDGKGLKTDNSWEVSCVDKMWLDAACWKFCFSDSPPSTFCLDTSPVTPVFHEKLEDGILYDFGLEMMGYVVFSDVSGSGTVFVSYGESREEALAVDVSELIDCFEVNGDFTSQIPKAFRYLYIKCDENVKIKMVTALSEYLPIYNEGDFDCSNLVLRKIYEVSIRTLHLNAREFFLDGIKRDRWVWSGDAYQSYMLNYYSFFDNDICKRTMRLIRGKDPVSTHFNTIQDYTLYWFIGLYEYYLYSGDVDFIRESYQKAISLMDFCYQFVDERGFLVSNENDWVFVDWAPIDNSGDISMIQLLFTRSVEAMSKISELCGDIDRHNSYQSTFNRMLPSLFSTFWSEKYGCFTHGPAKNKDAVITKYANIFAILYGYLSEEQIESVKKNALFADNVLKITTPYMRFYEMAALCEIGCQTEVRSYIEEYWGGMLDLGATSFWELYDPSIKGAEQYAMYGRPFGKSLCHAWGAGPVLLFGKYFLGVRPLKPGYEEFLITPNLGGLKYIKGKVPTPDGVIEVEYSEENIKIINHTEYKGTLSLNKENHYIAPHSEFVRKLSVKKEVKRSLVSGAKQVSLNVNS